MKCALLVIPLAALIAFNYARLPIATASGPSPYDLPNDCAIVASEAASRLAATGAWTHIVTVRMMRNGKLTAHSFVVWRPATTSHIWAYDEFLLEGSVDTGIVLGSAKKDLPAVVAVLAKVSNQELLEAVYCK